MSKYIPENSRHAGLNINLMQRSSGRKPVPVRRNSEYITHAEREPYVNADGTPTAIVIWDTPAGTEDLTMSKTKMCEICQRIPVGEHERICESCECPSYIQPKLYIEVGDRFFLSSCAFSEVCMHMQVAGKPMDAELHLSAYTGIPVVQLYEPADSPMEFSAPILAGEAGVYEETFVTRSGNLNTTTKRYYAHDAALLCPQCKTVQIKDRGTICHGCRMDNGDKHAAGLDPDDWSGMTEEQSDAIDREFGNAPEGKA